MLTGDVQKEKYVYNRCTGNRGKCSLPRFREEDIATRLGEPLKGLQVPPAIGARIVETLRDDQKNRASRTSSERTRLQTRLTSVRNRMDKPMSTSWMGRYLKIFGSARMGTGVSKEQQVTSALEAAPTSDQALDTQKVFELANRAYSLHVSQDSTEKAKLPECCVRTIP